MATPFNLAGQAFNFGGTPYSFQPQDPWTQLFQSLAPVLSGVGGLATANLDMNTARQAAGMADPFSGERQQYQTGLRNYMGANPVNPSQVTAGTNNALSMLGNLLQNPQSLTSQPGYQFGLNQALESVNRGAGASGLLNSGNRLAALEDRGQSYAQGWQQQIFNELLGNVGANINAANLGLGAQQQGYGELANLSGVNAGSPLGAAQALLGGRQQQANSIGSGIGGITNGIGGALGAFQRILGGSSGGGFNVPGGVSGMGTGGDWGSDVMGTGGDWGTDLLGAGTGGDWGSDFLDLGQFL